MVYKKVKFVEILVTFNSGDLAFIKSLLQSGNITYHIEGENFMQLRPLVQPASIKVDATQEEEAKELLKDFKSGNFGYEV